MREQPVAQINLRCTEGPESALSFVKYHGLSNDFMLMDLRGQSTCPPADWFQRQANRRCGVGFDQALLILDPECIQNDLSVEGFDVVVGYAVVNADGQWVAQCGNGARCVADWIMRQTRHPIRSLALKTTQGVMEVEVVKSNQYRVNMGAVRPGLSLNEVHPVNTLELNLLGQLFKGSCWFVGNPHVIIPVASVDHCELTQLNEKCCDALNQAVNVSCIEVIRPDRMRLRVYERGVGETYSCASAACCAVVAAQALGLSQERVQVSMRGGDLKVYWDSTQRVVYQEGPACPVYTGQWMAH
ncbi:MAG: diaminopimelate epimerase [Legionellales bacterium]|nr:diaminopimelate epimerase [Legionellales bacterium]|tara:strand:+ start:1023 stop:1922 length:900 start_codon:yes stop_codon:yes gene_type:complete